MYHPFSIADTLKAAWKLLKKNFVPVIIYSIISFILFKIVATIYDNLSDENDFVFKVILFTIAMIIQAYTTLGLYKLTFTLIDSEYYEFHIRQLFPKFTMVVSLICISLLTAFVIVTLVIVINFILKKHEIILFTVQILELIGFLYLSVRWLFCICFIVDDECGPIESLKESYRLTHGSVPQIILILLLSIVLIAIGCLLPEEFGIILTYPLVNIFLMEAYRKLVYSHQDVDDLDTETV